MVHDRPDPPAATVNSDNPGPFARMVMRRLIFIGAPHANAIELIKHPEPPLAWARSSRDKGEAESPDLALRG